MPTVLIDGKDIELIGAKVYRKHYGDGVIVGTVKSEGRNGTTYLCEVEFDGWSISVNAYDDELTFILAATPAPNKHAKDYEAVQNES